MLIHRARKEKLNITTVGDIEKEYPKLFGKLKRELISGKLQIWNPNNLSEAIDGHNPNMFHTNSGHISTEGHKEDI